MEIYLQSLLQVGVMLGVEYFGPSDGYDHHEFNIYLVFLRIAIKWK
jgi:hypothetical protein